MDKTILRFPVITEQIKQGAYFIKVCLQENRQKRGSKDVPGAFVLALTYKTYKPTLCIIVVTKDVEKNVKRRRLNQSIRWDKDLKFYPGMKPTQPVVRRSQCECGPLKLVISRFCEITGWICLVWIFTLETGKFRYALICIFI